MTYPKLSLLRRAGPSPAGFGHPWIYSNELKMDDAARALDPGTPVRLTNARGQAYWRSRSSIPHSLIAARVLSRNQNLTIDRCDFPRAAPAAAPSRHARPKLVRCTRITG